MFRWQRAAERFGVDWLTRIGSSEARVKDYSATGMYLEFEGKAPIGSVVEFVIAVEEGGKTLQMTCAGEVARIIEKDGKTGLGIRFTRPLKVDGAQDSGSDLWWRRL